MIANNTNRKGQAVQGAVRGGAALLAGLLRCGHCGRKLKVRYRTDMPANQYYCVRAIEEDNAGKVCTIISGGHLDRAVSEVLLQILAPLGIEAALASCAAVDVSRCERSRAPLRAAAIAAVSAPRTRSTSAVSGASAATP